MNYLTLIDDPFLISKYTQGFYTFPLIRFASKYIGETILFGRCIMYSDYSYLRIEYEKIIYPIFSMNSSESISSYCSDFHCKPYSQFYIGLISCKIRYCPNIKLSEKYGFIRIIKCYECKK